MAEESVELTLEQGSGNIFEDLGLPDSEQLLAQAKLTTAIRQVVANRHWSVDEAAAEMHLERQDVEEILGGRFPGASVERLLGCLLRLGRDVDITIHEEAAEGGSLRVAFG